MTTLPVLRRSAIQTADSCLFRYDKIWRQGEPDNSDPALIGIGYHAVVHRYIERLVAANLPADDEEARLAFPEGIAKAHTPARLVPEVRDIYSWWAEKFQLDLKNFLAAEERQEAGGFAPDLVLGKPSELEIIDFKTYRVALTESQLRQDFQARWYVFAAMKIWPRFPAYRFSHQYARLGRMTSVVFDPGELSGFGDEVAAVAASIEECEREGQWPATPGPECGYCNLQCPVVDRPALIPQRLPSLDVAVKAAEYKLAASQLLKQLDKSLKTWVSANGPLEVNGVVFDNRPSLVRTYPVDLVAKLLSERGIAGAFEGLTVSHSALSKLFKRFPDLEESLSSAVQTKTVYRFSAAKPGVDDEESDQ